MNHSLSQGESEFQLALEFISLSGSKRARVLLATILVFEKERLGQEYSNLIDTGGASWIIERVKSWEQELAMRTFRKWQEADRIMGLAV